MLKNTPKITSLQKLRRHLVLTMNLKKQKNTFKKYSLTSTKLNSLYYGYMGFVAKEDALVYYAELFSVLKQLKKVFPKKIKVINKVALVNAQTAKSSGIRMGKGKGAIKRYYAIIKKDSIFFEIYFADIIPAYVMDRLFNEVKTKLSFQFFYKFLNY